MTLVNSTSKKQVKVGDTLDGWILKKIQPPTARLPKGMLTVTPPNQPNNGREYYPVVFKTEFVEDKDAL